MGPLVRALRSRVLEVLKWLRENGCHWDAATCTLAARRGHREVLKWAIEQGCPAPSKVLCRGTDEHSKCLAEVSQELEEKKRARESNGCQAKERDTGNALLGWTGMTYKILLSLKRPLKPSV